MAAHLIMETLLRIEHKLDAILVAVIPKPTLSGRKVKQLEFSENTNCPVCEKPIKYDINMEYNVVERKCGCSTKKQIPLVPILGAPHVAAQSHGIPSGRQARRSQGG